MKLEVFGFIYQIIQEMPWQYFVVVKTLVAHVHNPIIKALHEAFADHFRALPT